MLPRFVVILCLAAGMTTAAAEPALPPVAARNIQRRGDLSPARWRFEKEQRGHVAFLGGSITEMDGYRPLVARELQRRFLQTSFRFTNAGIASTCSTTGAMRLRRDVLDEGPVDLLLVEFAVNDDQDAAHTRTECIRGLEGILHQVRKHNPRADIIVVYFVNPGMLEQIQKGKTPLPIAAHEAVAQHYGVSSVYLAKEVADRIAAGDLDWKSYGGTHPGPRGNALAAGMVARLFEDAWAEPLPEVRPEEYGTPRSRLDANSYVHGRLVDPGQANADKQWRVGEPPWSEFRGSVRSRFVKRSLLTTGAPGASLTLDFEGSMVGAYLLAGPDAGQVRVAIDDEPPRVVDLYHRFSGGLHYPRTVVFADDLPPGKHRLRLEVLPRTEGHGGTAVRILNFAAN